MTQRVDPGEVRRRRLERRAQQKAATAAAAGESAETGSGTAVAVVAQRTEGPVVIAQGRPQPALSLDDLPDAVDAPDAQGPLTAEEQERWELCRRSFDEFARAWWVMATAMDIALRGRLWRSDYDTAEAFIRDVAGMSTSNAYRQIAGARVAAILAQPAPLELLPRPAFEHDSNTLSRARDSSPATAPAGLTISQRAAEALTPIRADYDDETAAAVYRAVAEAMERDSVAGTVISGLVRRLPRRADEDLDVDALCDLARNVVLERTMSRAAADDPVRRFAEHVDAARDFAASTRGMAAAYRAAVAADPAAAERLTGQLRRHMTRAAKNFPSDMT